MNTTEDPIANIAAHSDGSGNALERERHEFQQLADLQSKLELARMFATKHRELLAGASWEFDLIGRFDKPIEIRFYAGGKMPYRGQSLSPLEFIAALFPDIDWHRVNHSNYDDTYRDLYAETEGIALRITYAEKAETVKVSRHKANGRVQIPKTQGSTTEF